MDGISKTKKQKNILYNHLKIFYDHIIIAAIYRYRKNMTGIKVMTNPITLFASLICKTTPTPMFYHSNKRMGAINRWRKAALER